MTHRQGSAAAFGESARYLADRKDATWVDLLDSGLMSSEALLAPERILSFAVDGSRHDLVAEFRKRPLGPYSDELRHLVWLLRAQTPGGRYVLRKLDPARWQVARLMGKRRPQWEPLEGDYETLEDAEWAVFALRWRDHTGENLALRRADA